jgi:hypothetical protein
MTSLHTIAERVHELGPRPCPGSCGRTVPSGTFACRDCWRSLPPPSRRAVNAAWRAVKDATDADTLGAAINRYERVTADAVLMLGSRLGL